MVAANALCQIDLLMAQIFWYRENVLTLDEGWTESDGIMVLASVVGWWCDVGLI